jgi:phthiocerol/phenolphthiocerol synthesis type-I polyketide synthase E
METQRTHAPSATAGIYSTPQNVGTGDDTSEQLARIWQELLRIDSVALDQNYFDLGGDSSLAVQMFAEIEKIFKVKLPLATLYDAPTIEELARVVQGEALSSRWSPLVAIQQNGSRPPLFFVHPHGGNVLVYRALSQHLGSDQPFYGLQSQGLDGDQPLLKTIEDMAALYLKEMRRVQPHGPYFLGGYCMGGTIAFEMAQRLRATGEAVALLALIDTTECSNFRTPSLWAQSYYNVQRLMFHMANFASLDSEGRSKYLRAKVKSLRSMVTVGGTTLLEKFRRHPGAAKSEPWVLGQIWQANFQACLDYAPQPYSGTLTDIRPAKQYRMFKRPDMTWDRFAGGEHEVIVLPVNVPATLIEPFVKELAIALRKQIDAAIRTSAVGQSQESFARSL